MCRIPSDTEPYEFRFRWLAPYPEAVGGDRCNSVETDAGNDVILKHEQIQETLDGSPAIAHWGLVVTRVDHDEGRVTLRMPFLPHLERGEGSGQFHGGPIASLIDVAGDAAIAIYLDGWVPTISLRVDYLRPATGAHLDAHATVRRRGRTIGVVDVDVLDEEGRLCAIGRGTYSTIVG